jgi:peptide/nickel transport system substrate-binding protein
VGSPAGLAYGDGSVWVVNGTEGTVSRISPATHAVVEQVPVGSAPSAVAVTAGNVWVTNSGDGTVSRINTAANTVVQTTPVGNVPVAITSGPSGVWVTNSGDALPNLDPMRGYDDVTTPALATVYDGLVALRRSGGAASLTLVPDLARTLPHPAGGGTAYTFTLRRIRYSNGALVRASDFRRGIMRQLSFGDYPPYYEGILGGQACHRDPRRCDLSAGIIINDAAGTVTFHLGHADPDFLYKLALIIAVPAPPGAPDHAIDRAPFLPGTGPYKLSHYRRNASLTLVRNPYFRQWSYAAQPAGYPSVIRYDQVASPGQQESAVIGGRADVAGVGNNGQFLATRYPTRVHAGLKSWTTYLFLNTRQPPFTSLKARQAVNYAIDRGRILQLLHRAPGQAAVTCQILPADFPGHQSYCPYTTGSKDKIWYGPDMAKARRLAKDSHTTNVPVTVWTFQGFANGAVNSYLVRLLKDLGYRAHQRTVSIGRFFTAAANVHSTMQAGSTHGAPASPVHRNSFSPP